MKAKWIYLFGALGGLLFGYDTGVISGAILFIEQQLHINPWQQGWVVSGVLLGAVIGSIVIGPMSDRYGRRKILLLSAMIFFVGALFCGLAPNFILLVISRIILGLAVGAASSLVPTYLAEIAPTENRGGIGTLFQLMIMSGILIAYISNYALSDLYHGWRIMLALATIPAVLLFIGGLKLPESPRYLVKMGQMDLAQANLRIFSQDEAKIKQDLTEIKLQSAQENGGLKELFGKTVRPVLIMAMGLAIFQQIMGCNTVLYYAPNIFTDVGFGVNAL